MMICSKHKQNGLSLVELMIAVTLGLLLTGAVVSFFTQTKRSYLENDNYSRMQENARFAMDILAQDLMHAGFLGEATATSDVTIISSPAPNAPATCSTLALTWYDFVSVEDAINYSHDLSDSDVATNYSNCLASTDVKDSDNNILFITRTFSVPVGSTVTNSVYIRSNGVNSILYQKGVTSDPSFTGNDWLFQPVIYYIDDDNILSRKYLNYTSATPSITSEPLVSGIEYFHIEFGIDTDLDGAPNYYYSPASGASTDATLNNAVTARIFVLARTPDEDFNYSDGKTYTMGGKSLSSYNDHFHRRVYTTTVALKNLRNQLLATQ